ncbi:hypothetical protein [Undibacterium sp.]|uniref:hypothetical protein n=1 Tax=Undibacterium sp. TaxID=1914977 RepID=UPI00374CC96C
MKKFYLMLTCVALMATTQLSIAGTRPLAAPAISTFGTFGTDSLQHIVESRHGQSFVLVLWSLDCTYCQSSMATLAKGRAGNSSLQVVTLLTEQAPQQKAAALMRSKLGYLGLATGKGAGAENWAFGTAPPEQLRFVVDPAWHGELPRSYWYHADGSRTAYSGVITTGLIQKMLAQENREYKLSQQ